MWLQPPSSHCAEAFPVPEIPEGSTGSKAVVSMATSPGQWDEELSVRWVCTWGQLWATGPGWAGGSTEGWGEETGREQQKHRVLG